MPPHNPNQLPRNGREPDSDLPGQDLVDDAEDVDDDSEDSDDSSDDDSDSGGEANSGGSEDEPDDDDRQTRLRRLRRRHHTLLRRRAIEERLLEREVMLRDQVVRVVEIMESRVQALRTQRASDLAELRALETEPPDDDGRDEVEGPVSSNGNTPIDATKTEVDKAFEKTEENKTEHE